MEQQLCLTTEASRIIGCSAGTVINLANSGKLPCTVTASGARVFRVADVEECARRRAQERQEAITRKKTKLAKTK